MLILLTVGILEEVADEGVSGGGQQLDNVLVERVHVLEEPLVGLVLHLGNSQLETLTVNTTTQ